MNRYPRIQATKMKFYDCKGLPNPARVRIALAEKRMLDKVEFVQVLDKVEFVHVDVPGGKHRGPQFLPKNPSGPEPVVELDDGTLSSESAAIDQNRDRGLRQRDVALATMRRLDGVLAGQDYMAGDRFTVADITAMPGLIFMGFAKIDTPAECAHLEARRARVWSRPSAAAAA